jgi:signal peptidase I
LIFVPAALIGGVFVNLGWFTLFGTWALLAVYKHQRKGRQARANATPYEQVGDEPFVLFLRPFRTPGRLASRTRVRGYVDRLLMGEFWDVELAISYAIRRRARAVAIGDPGHSIGALKVTSSDETWKDKFAALGADAAAIVMIPATSASVRWEVGYLLGNARLLAKTLFVMPPRPYRVTRWPELLIGRGPGRFWNAARKTFKASGIELPAYKSGGLLFTLGADGRVTSEIDPAGFAEDRICAAVLDRAPDRPLPQVKRPWWSLFPLNLTPLHPGALGSLFGGLLFFLILLPSWFLFSTFAYEVRSIPSESMMPTLQVGDRVTVAKFAYGYNRSSIPFGLGRQVIGDDPANPEERFSGSTPKRGDIVLFQHPHSDRVLVERVIGMPGDTVQMKSGRLFLNDVEVPRGKPRSVTYVSDDGSYLISAAEYVQTIPTGAKDKDGNAIAKSFLIHEFSDEDSLDETPRFRVPAGHVFLMGDNRDNAEDSRAPSGHRLLVQQDPEGWPLRSTSLPADTRDDAIGFVPLDHLIGRAGNVLFSLNKCKPVEGAECPPDRSGHAL